MVVWSKKEGIKQQTYENMEEVGTYNFSWKDDRRQTQNLKVRFTFLLKSLMASFCPKHYFHSQDHNKDKGKIVHPGGKILFSHSYLCTVCSSKMHITSLHMGYREKLAFPPFSMKSPLFLTLTLITSTCTGTIKKPLDPHPSRLFAALSFSEQGNVECFL